MEKYENGTSSSPENNVYAEVNRELRDVIRNLTSIDKELRKSVFDRMLAGPEMQTTDPSLIPFFEQVADIEDRYGKDRVAEMATFYVTPEATK